MKTENWGFVSGEYGETGYKPQYTQFTQFTQYTQFTKYTQNKILWVTMSFYGLL